MQFRPFYHLAGVSPLPLHVGYLFFGGIQHSLVNGHPVATCSFGVLAGEDERMSFYSAILKVTPQFSASSVLHN